ncbi:MAG TPA: BON domain-containing protein [Candidatus Polarisedimenticolaceae bacterium]|nr:BON domain-containing protein [Candidatus Polarisedimenticolaceae bacterium]
MSSAPEAPAYLVERVRSALAHDSRVNELGICVQLLSGKIFLTGVVASEERRRSVEEVVKEHAPDTEIHNEIRVQRISEGNGEKIK